MSDNPFKDPPQKPAGQVGIHPSQTGTAPTLPSTSPGALTPILVFCIIFGVMGLFGSCAGGGLLLAMPMIAEIIENAPLPEEEKVFNRLNINAQKAVLLPNLVLMCVNLVVATMLIIGSIGCFKRKESSRGFLRLALLAAIFYSILKIAVTVYSYFASSSAMTESIEQLKNDPMYEDVKTQFTANQIFTVGGLVVGVLVAVAIMGFYFWARSYLGKPQVEEHFAAVTQYKNNATV